MSNAGPPSRPGLHRVIRHPTTPLVGFTIAAAVVIVGTFLPWLRSGSTSRSSYDLLGLLSRLDVASDGVVSRLIRWWPVVPLLVTTAVVAAWWRWTTVAVVAAVLAATYAGGVGLTMATVAREGGITVGPGPVVCAVASGALLAGAVWLGVSARRRVAPTPVGALPDDRS